MARHIFFVQRMSLSKRRFHSIQVLLLCHLWKITGPKAQNPHNHPIVNQLAPYSTHSKNCPKFTRNYAIKNIPKTSAKLPRPPPRFLVPPPWMRRTSHPSSASNVFRRYRSDPAPFEWLESFAELEGLIKEASLQYSRFGRVSVGVWGGVGRC